MVFDPSRLDDEELLRRGDDGRLLWAIAGAGAQVRRAIDTASEFGVNSLTGAERPRAVLLVGDPECEGALLVLRARLSPGAPTLIWAANELPRWAGPADALLAASVDGRDARVASLLDQASRRGLMVCAVAPAGSPVAYAAGRAPVAALEPSVHPRAALWAVLTPLLHGAGALDLIPANVCELARIADALDEMAEVCRPASDSFTNPAKALATELAQARPIIAGPGPLAGVAAELFADRLRLTAGASAIAVGLPAGLATAIALIAGADQPGGDDFFQDRTETEPALPPRLILLGADDPGATRAATNTLDDVARRYRVRSSTVDVPLGDPLVRLATAVAFGTFTAAYLSLALGLDPSALGRPEDQR